jgi:1-phosphofructokinase
MAAFEQIVTVCVNPAIDRVLEVPDFAVGSHQRGRQLARHPAGKAVNVSRALGALGVPSIAAGFVGRNELEYFERFLSAFRVNTQFLTVDGATRENVTLVDPIARRETHVRDVGFTVSARDLTRLKKKLHLISRPTTLVIFSGSVPHGIEPQAFADLLDICLHAEAKVAVDTSGPALKAAAALPLWLAKPNAAELGEMVGQTIASDDEIIATGRQLSRRIRGLLVSRGEAGGYAFVDGSAFVGQVPVARQRIVNTVGCGDCLLAGFVTAQLRGQNVRESYRFGLAVATAAAVSREAGPFDLRDVQEFLAAASVEPLQ